MSSPRTSDEQPGLETLRICTSNKVPSVEADADHLCPVVLRTAVLTEQIYSKLDLR